MVIMGFPTLYNFTTSFCTVLVHKIAMLGHAIIFSWHCQISARLEHLRLELYNT